MEDLKIEQKEFDLTPIIAVGFECAIAIATEAEVQNGSACGQMSIITED